MNSLLEVAVQYITQMYPWEHVVISDNMVAFNVTSSHYTSLKKIPISLFVEPKSHLCKACVSQIATVDNSKRNDAVSLCNKLNQVCFFAKFYVDETNAISATYHFMPPLEDGSDETFQYSCSFNIIMLGDDVDRVIAEIAQLLA
ncbi:MAG: hypothetical protein LIO72_06890 [Ruminococcus sp.]|nr:hypothetical protein [Ruminococcus sp.]